MYYKTSSSKQLKAIFRLTVNVNAALTLLILSSCLQPIQPENITPGAGQYSADSLAKDWREQVRKNPNNPFEGLSFPADNDSDYYYPKKSLVKKPSQKQPSHNKYNTIPAFDENDDSSYGKFPRYNPDDDNVYIDSKQYPLYLE